MFIYFCNVHIQIQMVLFHFYIYHCLYGFRKWLWMNKKQGSNFVLIYSHTFFAPWLLLKQHGISLPACINEYKWRLIFLSVIWILSMLSTNKLSTNNNYISFTQVCFRKQHVWKGNCIQQKWWTLQTLMNFSFINVFWLQYNLQLVSIL